MGVLNLTRDSFSDGGRYLDPDAALHHARDMIAGGADLIDVGGESTRPGAEPVPAGVELERVIPVIRRLKQEIDRPISIDTYKHEVARDAVAAGADLINDISGLNMDPRMAVTVAGAGVPVIIGHIRGTPRDMQESPCYGDPVREVVDDLGVAVSRALDAGIAAERILVDPGIGFGKRTEDNLALLANLSRLHSLGRPIVIGTSRKNFIGQVLDLPVHERLEGTLATEVIAACNGAHIVRTHDVRATVRAIRMAGAVCAAPAEA
jgi:dihydropteroate synthase